MAPEIIDLTSSSPEPERLLKAPRQDTQQLTTAALYKPTTERSSTILTQSQIESRPSNTSVQTTLNSREDVFSTSTIQPTSPAETPGKPQLFPLESKQGVKRHANGTPKDGSTIVHTLDASIPAFNPSVASYSLASWPSKGTAANNGQDSFVAVNSAISMHHTPATQGNIAPTQPLLDTTKSSFGQEFTKEEDSLLVYLKDALRWDWREIAAVTNGRTQGSCATRYCKKLKGKSSIRSAIRILEVSPLRHFLRSDLNADILARPSPADSHEGSFGDVQPEDQTVVSGRRRRAAYKQTTYYPTAFRVDVPMDISDNSETLVAQNSAGPHHRQPSPSRSKRIERRKSRPVTPYLSYSERLALRQGFGQVAWTSEQITRWRNTAVHVPFSEEEVVILERIMFTDIGHSAAEAPEETLRRFQSMMRDATEAEILEFASLAQGENGIETRTRESIEAFLRDCAQGFLDDAASILRLGNQSNTQSMAALLRQREMGSHEARRDRFSSKGLSMEIRSRILDTLGPSFSFTGTSGDVNSLAWAPDSVHFAAGSACLVDINSMQYNRPNNLLFGDMLSKTVQELPDHYTNRKKPNSGINASHSMHATQDRRLFQTVSTVEFSSDQNLLYSGGYDKKVRIWDVSHGVKAKPLVLKHKGKVDLLAVSKTGLLATGTQRTKNSIKVLKYFLSNDSEIHGGLKLNFSSRKAMERPENAIYPSALRFSHSGEHLLAGFSATSRDEVVTGETCVFDIRSGQQMIVWPDTRNVFDCQWHPFYSTLFAVGCVAGANVNRGVRSVVKLYDWRLNQSRYTKWLELDCPALDMNDIVYSPYDENLILAACTNGKTYVWDIRNPDEILLTLTHGRPLMELGDPEDRERLDTGIRFATWGHDRKRFYSGSSDGVLRSWDLYRSSDDAHVKDIVTLNSGIMCGALSPDHSTLLLGEVNGSINVLEVGHSSDSLKDTRSLMLRPAFEYNSQAQLALAESVVDTSGVEAARHLISQGKIQIKPMGALPVRQAVQDLRYDGPYDRAPDAETLRAEALRFQNKIVPSGQQCQIDGCRENITKISIEESGDSGRSADRIPGALRFPHQNTRAGKVSCKNCSRPARPCLDSNQDPVNDTPRCERCCFTCFHCGQQAEVDDTAEFVKCAYCKGRWRAEILGYRVLSKPETPKKESRVPYRRSVDLYSWNMGEPDESYTGSDCENEYYQTLWTDREPSPL